MSLSEKKIRRKEKISDIQIGEVSERHRQVKIDHRESRRVRDDISIEIGSGKNLIESHMEKRRKKRNRSKYENNSGWLPLINIILIGILFVLLALFYLHWNGEGEETSLARIEGKNFIPKPQMIINNMRESYHNHTKTMTFKVNVQSGKLVRYPKVGHIEELDPNSLIEHRLCCHVDQRLFICDYGQGASANIGLECVVEYSKETSEAHLRIFIQSDEMKGAICTFRWTSVKKVEFEPSSIDNRKEIENAL